MHLSNKLQYRFSRICFFNPILRDTFYTFVSCKISTNKISTRTITSTSFNCFNNRCFKTFRGDDCMYCTIKSTWITTCFTKFLYNKIVWFWLYFFNFFDVFNNIFKIFVFRFRSVLLTKFLIINLNKITPNIKKKEFFLNFDKIWIHGLLEQKPQLNKCLIYLNA